MKTVLTTANFFLLLFFSVEASLELWRNVGTCGEGLTCDPACQLRCLEIHNYYRSLHNSPPLTCDSTLARSAQQWADEQAKDGRMAHSKWTDKYTELISWRAQGWEGMDQINSAIAGAVRGWYSEIKNDYNYETGKSEAGQAVGHFQAVVWNSTTTLGCGINIKSGDAYVNAHLSPASHASVDYYKLATLNVKPRKDPASKCNIQSSSRVLCDKNLIAPYVTPVECISRGCCYDDMFMTEPSVWFYNAQGRKWCFKPKN